MLLYALALLGLTPLANATTPFEWGVAWSAHQTEGSAGGGENSDWYQLEHDPNSPIGNQDTADLATDFWHRSREDLLLAQKLGVNTVRTSLAWEKIQPAPGEFDESVIAHYRQLLQDMRALNLRPVLAFHHFTHPLWFVQEGGWLNPRSPRLFAEYVDHVVRALGDLCETWITFNEPMILVIMGYITGQYPPQIKNPWKAFEAGFQLVRAHRLAARAIHAIQGPSPGARSPEGRLRGVGVVNSWPNFEPEHAWNPLDHWMTRVLSEANNWAWVRGALQGRFKISLPILMGMLKFPVWEKRVPDGEKNSDHPDESFIDWIGANHYASYRVGFHPIRWSATVTNEPGAAVADNGWPTHADGLARVLLKAAREFPGIPLVVSENGLADAKDAYRPRLIRENLAALDAIRDQVDLRGYTHWSLTDNFEWLAGYQYRFGLYQMDYQDNLKRTARPSAEVYREEILKRLELGK